MSQGLCRNCGDRLYYAYKLCERCYNSLERQLKAQRAEFLKDLNKHYNFQIKIKDLIKKWEAK